MLVHNYIVVLRLVRIVIAISVENERSDYWHNACRKPVCNIACNHRRKHQTHFYGSIDGLSRLTYYLLTTDSLAVIIIVKDINI